MPQRVVKTVTLLAFATLSALAMAADPPARVGRVALAQGRVGIASDAGAEPGAAQVNWPVTSGNMISTAAGARTEVRIGSTSIRLDGDSSLEVIELDDDSLRLRLHYGSASVHVRNPQVLAGFELATPQARIRLQQTGRLRVDAERVRDTSTVNVFDGTALVDGGGSQLTVRAGKRAELTEDDVRTLVAQRDGFDDWSAARDKLEDNPASARYVDTEMTGYEDLDRYGSWRVDSEYGPLWTPSVASSWVPYRDGSWTWLDPWGWTWVDNAPWGYAPFHYGRWVQVNQRWAWAPGRRGPDRRSDHPVWAPALVGWVGGAGWNLTFRDRSRRPATGWYPLSPHERFVPGYRAPEQHLRWLNSHVRSDPQRGRDFRPQGLTVVPQERFGQPGRVNVARAPIASVPPALAQNVQAGAPPAAPNRPPRAGRVERGPEREHERDRDHDRGDRIDSGRVERDGFVRQRPLAPVTAQAAQVAPAQGVPIVSPPPRQSPQPGTIVSPPPPQSPQPGTIVSPPPHQPQSAAGPGPAVPTPLPLQPQMAPNPGWSRSERREQLEELRRNRRPMPAPAQVQPQVQPSAAVGGAAPAAVQPASERNEARIEARSEQRPERGHRGDWERPSGPAPQRMAPPAVVAPAALAPVAPRPAALPAAAPPTAAPPAAAPAPRPAPAERADGERRQRGEQRGDQRGRQQER